MKRLAIGFILGAFLVPAVAFASDFYGNSFDISWIEHRDLVNVLHNRSVEAKIKFHVSLYVSTKGRIFSKVDFVNNRSRLKEGLAGPGVPEGGQQWSWQWHLSSIGIKGYGHVPGGQDARLLAMTVQNNERCDAKVSIGKKQGAKSVVESPGGKMLKILSDEVSDLTCTVQKGNILAGGVQ